MGISSPPILIRIQREDFTLQQEYEKLRRSSMTGAVVTFTGLVRDFQVNPAAKNICRLTLQHFPEMAEQQMRELAQIAMDNWSLQRINMIHRIGTLEPMDQIVFIGVAASHRRAAYQANEFLIDKLKSEVALWKKIDTGEQPYWLDANPQDQSQVKRWAEVVNLRQISNTKKNFDIKRGSFIKNDVDTKRSRGC